VRRPAHSVYMSPSVCMELTPAEGDGEDGVVRCHTCILTLHLHRRLAQNLLDTIKSDFQRTYPHLAASPPAAAGLSPLVPSLATPPGANCKGLNPATRSLVLRLAYQDCARAKYLHTCKHHHCHILRSYLRADLLALHCGLRVLGEIYVSSSANRPTVRRSQVGAGYGMTPPASHLPPAQPGYAPLPGQVAAPSPGGYPYGAAFCSSSLDCRLPAVAKQQVQPCCDSVTQCCCHTTQLTPAPCALLDPVLVSSEQKSSAPIEGIRTVLETRHGAGFHDAAT